MGIKIFLLGLWCAASIEGYCTDADTNILPLDEKKYRALINPDKLKQDYDDKIFSIDYNAGYQPGDVFEWQTERGPLTQWLVYLPAMTEDAYFESEIRRWAAGIFHPM